MRNGRRVKKTGEKVEESLKKIFECTSNWLTNYCSDKRVIKRDKKEKYKERDSVMLKYSQSHFSINIFIFKREWFNNKCVIDKLLCVRVCTFQCYNVLFAHRYTFWAIDFIIYSKTTHSISFSLLFVLVIWHLSFDIGRLCVPTLFPLLNNQIFWVLIFHTDRETPHKRFIISLNLITQSST